MFFIQFSYIEIFLALCSTYNKLNEMLYDFKMKFKYIFNIFLNVNVQKRVFFKLIFF
jgi:hypothetical protein